MTCIVGIDPGLSGAVAFVNVDACTIRIVDMPTNEFATSTKNKTEVDPYGIVTELLEQDVMHVYLEEVFSSPQMGVTSSFNFGEGKGMIRGVLAALQIPLTQVKPQKWKKDMRVPADKKAAVMRASQLIPGAAPKFKGPRGGLFDGRAEAALIALYGALELGQTPTSPLKIMD